MWAIINSKDCPVFDNDNVVKISWHKVPPLTRLTFCIEYHISHCLLITNCNIPIPLSEVIP